MKIIVAADKNWGIGKDNKLLVSIPADMQNVSSRDHWQGLCYGKKDPGEFPRRASS